MNYSVKSLVFIGLFSSLITIGAFIKIPFFIVPVTLQTLFVVLAGFMLSRKDSLMSVSLYLIMGLLGFPVFARGGGFGYVFQPTFGYLIGFLFCVLFIGYFNNKVKNKFVLGCIGVLIIYLIGCGYFSLIQFYLYGVTYKFSWIIYNLFLIFLPGGYSFLFYSKLY